MPRPVRNKTQRGFVQDYKVFSAGFKTFQPGEVHVSIHVEKHSLDTDLVALSTAISLWQICPEDIDPIWH